ncbi:hypothetical protein TNCV_449741 [Trichonephila clavipes]|nr:hypothetical protein TNCV_449741 [Trichonephila clavipes]
MALSYPHSQIYDESSRGTRRPAVGKCRLMILSSPKGRRSPSFIQRVMCRGASSYVNTVVASHRLTRRAGIKYCSNNEAYS